MINFFNDPDDLISVEKFRWKWKCILNKNYGVIFLVFWKTKTNNKTKKRGKYIYIPMTNIILKIIKYHLFYFFFLKYHLVRQQNDDKKFYDNN